MKEAEWKMLEEEQLRLEEERKQRKEGIVLIYNHNHMHATNPSNAEATFVQITRMQRVLKTIETLPCWYSLDSSRWVLSDKYPFARVSGIVL